MAAEGDTAAGVAGGGVAGGGGTGGVCYGDRKKFVKTNDRSISSTYRNC